MKRFSFPLRPVAVLREHRELRAKEAFAASVHAVAQAVEEHGRAQQRLARFGAAIATRRTARFAAAAEAQNLAGYRRECAAEAAAARAVAAARIALERARQDYVGAHRDAEAVHRLETKARAAHRHAAAREEQAGFDDLALRRQFTRRPLPAP